MRRLHHIGKRPKVKVIMNYLDWAPYYIMRVLFIALFVLGAIYLVGMLGGMT